MLQRIRHFFTGRDTGIETHLAASYQSRNAAILHIDMVASTQQVRNDPVRAHRQVEQLYARLCFIAGTHNAIPRELRGDAAVVEFQSVADAIRAARALHDVHQAMSRSRLGLENPRIRTGISYGEIIGEDMLTGEAVIRAQRLEQLSSPGEVLLDQPAADQLADKNEVMLECLKARVLKGFGEPMPIYQVKTILGNRAVTPRWYCNGPIGARAA